MPSYSPSSLSARIKHLLPAIFVVTLVTAALTTTGVLFFFRSRSIMEEQLKDKLRSTAAAAAMQFDGTNFDPIQRGTTMENSEVLRDIVAKLVKTKEITHIRYAYLTRTTNDPNTQEFIAEADMAASTEELDENRNGTIEDSEKAAEPGELYDVSNLPRMRDDALLHPTVDDTVTLDRWGSLISGYAPVRSKSGKTVAILGLDMEADEFLSLSRSIFSPVALLLIVLATFFIGTGTTLYLWKRRLEILQRLELERSGLLRLAFHQLGGPLTIISWSIEELEQEGPASIQRTIANIQEGVKRLTGILKMLKDADLVHTGKVDYKPELASVSSILEKVVKEVGAKLAIRRQHVEMNIEQNITMNLDPKLIAGVAQELLTNAIDFSPDKSVINVRCRKVGRFAEFTIEDHGYGVPKKDQHRMFGEFTRGSNATKYKADGNGLGLYIVKGIVEHAGGKVSLKSVEGVGTTVTVLLPLA